jgi:predicted transcriptional regulator
MALAEASDAMGCSQLSAAQIAKTIGKGTDTVKHHLHRMEHDGRIKVRRLFKLNEAGEPVGKKTVSFVCGEKVYWLGGRRGNVIQIVGVQG